MEIKKTEKQTKEEKLIEEWNKKLEEEGLGVLKGTYVSNKSFWQLDINRRKRYSA